MNRYINTVIPYDAFSGPPKQSLADAMRGGQCRDYVRHKAATLLMVGYPRKSMRVMLGLYKGKPHSVLAFQPVGAGEPWILDNTTREVMPLSMRADLAGFEMIALPGDWT